MYINEIIDMTILLLDMSIIVTKLALGAGLGYH